jgi:glycosyltransferase involved in cell wall biosynthesis
MNRTVSVCTPTFNRREFIPILIECFNHQTYPKHLIEWIIIDDGDDKVQDLFKNIPQVKYFYYNKPIILGEKRNLMNSKATGDIIVYMDDDDYYPPERISHAVTKLVTNPSCMVAGSTYMYNYFANLNKVYLLGPYGNNHSTGACLAFKKSLLSNTVFDNKKDHAEESSFLKKYSFKMVQLDPEKTVLAMSHYKNTFDRNKLVGNNERCVVTNKKIKQIVKNKNILQMYQKLYDNIKNKKKEFKY